MPINRAAGKWLQLPASVLRNCPKHPSSMTTWILNLLSYHCPLVCLICPVFITFLSHPVCIDTHIRSRDLPTSNITLLEGAFLFLLLRLFPLVQGKWSDNQHTICNMNMLKWSKARQKWRRQKSLFSSLSLVALLWEQYDFLEALFNFES